MSKAPLELETPRLLLRRPRAADARAIFERYSSDREATRYMAWPMHTTINDTYAFLTFSDAEWRRWPAGPYVIHSRDGRLLGSTGYAFETLERAITGYIFARDAWGLGYATESLRAMVELAPRIGIRLLTASCHAEHAASAHVLEKCGFVQEARLASHMVFPNLGSASPADVLAYSLAVSADSSR
jgi:[ribosomal protein S5]-alanine N-acetyltransferase